MASNIDPVQSLTTEKRQWRIQVRAVRLWKQPSFYDASDSDDCLEVVFVDRAGTRIQGTINSVLIEKFERLIREEENYIIHGFTVISNQQKRCKAFDTNFKIVFQFKTVVFRFESPVIPTYGFKLQDFALVTQVSNNNEFLIDVAGMVRSPRNLKHIAKGTHAYRNVSFYLDDLMGTKLKCIMWAEFVDQWVQYVKSNPKGPYIVVLQFAKLDSKYSYSSYS